MLSYPACYCINLRCFFQTLYRNAFSSLRDHLWYSPLRSSSDPYWNWSFQHHCMKCFECHKASASLLTKRELLIETWRYQVTVYAGVGKSPEWWRASVRRASVIALLQTVLYSVLSGPPLISVREIFLKSSCNCLLKGQFFDTCIRKQLKSTLKLGPFMTTTYFPREKYLWKAVVIPCLLLY